MEMANIPETMFISGDASCAISEMRDTSASVGGRSTVCSSENWYTSDEDSFTEVGFPHVGRNGLHGRQDEISKMKQTFMDIISDGEARLLLVAGVSGSGKSALVEHMRDFVTSSECHGFFCDGKFEQSLLDGGTAEPFSALATAFSDVIDFILNSGDKLQARSKAVSQALGADSSMLIDFVPNFLSFWEQQNNLVYRIDIRITLLAAEKVLQQRHPCTFQSSSGTS